MNKIYKVMYSKVKQCCVVVSEIAKSHSHNGESSGVKKHAALTAAVLIALGSLSFTTAFVPMTAEAADKTRTGGSNFVGVERTDGLFDDDDYANYNGQGAHGDNSITIGLKAVASEGTITIGDRDASTSLGSVYVGRGPGMPTGKTMPTTSDKGYWATSVGYQSDATGYGSIAIGSNATANNSYDKDSTGHGIQLRVPSGDGSITLNGKPDIQRASVAIGYGASADNGNIAIGSYSDASTDLRATTGDAAKAYLTEKTADSYVSVGKTGALRRISNVADGAADSDVATIRQLKTLSDKAGVYNEGWGIKIADEIDDNGKVTKKNAISVDRNLGNNSTSVTQVSNTGLILGGDFSGTDQPDEQPDEKYGNYGATGQYAVTLGGRSNRASGESSVAAGGMDNTADGNQAFVGGGSQNTASGRLSSAIGGAKNTASGLQSSAFGGSQNTASGQLSSAIGGDQNTASGFQSSAIGGDQNTASGSQSSAIGGAKNIARGWHSSAFGGTDNISLDLLSSTLGGMNSVVLGYYATGIAGGSTGSNAWNALAAGSNSVVTVENGTAIGYQATTNEEGTIAFGHDKGDISGYTVTWKQKATSANGKYYDAKGVEITKDQYEALRNPDYTFNDYSKDPTITENTHKTAAYNRLVKVHDGKNAHDAVVMEQLKPYTKSDASNIGSNLKTYTVGDDGETITETDATEEQQKDNKDAWGLALGAGTFTTGTSDKATDASTSDQLVTGKTLYNYDKPTGTLNYVNVNNTTGQNLSALDAQVKANAVTLNDKTHNIKYYSVEDKISDDKLLPSISGYSNEKNDGAKGAGSMAAGFNTHADGIASTVAGSYSGVIGTGLQGAAALSYGTFNVNQNTDAAKDYSGVANSIVGQANMTKDSNAAIIYGAGNTVTNSYRKIDDTNASEIMQAALSKDVKKLDEALQKAVPTSGGQVMVMGGGNNVESAYMTQVVGVGNTVKGNQVYTKDAKTGKWNWTTDTNDKTAIKDYDPEKSSQYNYVDGFSNEVINGKHDYVIGANNKLSGDSYDDDTAQPIKRSNRSNIVIGDNHTLTREQNTVIIGSSDTENTQTKARDAVIIGHNANATNDTGADNAVAIGRSATATGGNAVTIGVNTSAGANSITIGSESSAISGSNIAIGRYAKVYGYKVTNAVALGQKAEAHVADGVAIGSESQATVAGNSVEGYDPGTGEASTDETATWKATKAAVSIGTADGKVTRQINGLAAGTNDTDAVNVAQLKKLEGMKANVDATNIGKNLKGADGKTASTEEITANEKAWGAALGTGDIATPKDMLVTDKAIHDELRPTTDGTYVKGSQTTAENLSKLDAQVKTNTDGISTNTTNITKNAGDITNLKNLSNITNEGEKVIKKLSKDAVKVEAGDRVTVTSTDNKETGTITYKVSANNNGTVTAGDQNLVSGDTVNTAINNAITNAGTATDTKLAGKANVDATNIGKNLNHKADGTAVTDEDKTANENAWGAAIGTGSIAADNGQLVTGKTVYAYNKPVAAEGKTLNYISDTKTTGQNLTALDTQIKTNADNIGTNTTNISNNTENITNLKNLSNITEAGQTVIKNLAKGSIGMENGSHTTASHRDVNGVDTYKVDVTVDGQVTKNNKGIVDGGTVYNAIQDVKAKTSADLANKANVDASNLSDENVKSWQEKLGNGEVVSGNKGLVTGDTVFKAVDTKANRDGSNLTDKEANSFSEKIARGEVKAGENRAVSGDAVSQAISKVTGDMNTKLDGKANTSLDNITYTGKNVIRDLAKGSVKVIEGTNTTVTAVDGEGETPTTYAVNVEGKGTVASGDTGLISGGTAYSELRPADGSYVKQANTTAVNLFALDTGLKATSDLIHTNTSHDTIQIGENSTATKIDVSGKDANGKTTGRVITGVISDAGDPNSAANVGYVNGVTAANTQQIYQDMNSAYGRLNNNINKAAAGSNALAALHPLDYDPDDKADFAVGYGHYRNANAAAVGAFYHPNENTMVNVGVSLGNGDPGFNAGVSFKIGSGSAGRQAMSKTEMAKVINSQSKEIDALKKDNADKDKRIDALEQKMAEILAKLDKNGK